LKFFSFNRKGKRSGHNQGDATNSKVAQVDKKSREEGTKVRAVAISRISGDQCPYVYIW